MSDPAETERRANDRAAKRLNLILAILGALLSTLIGAGAAYLAVNDDIGSNTAGVQSNREDIVKIDAAMEAQRQANLEFLKQQVRLDTRLDAMTASQQRMERILEKIAQGK